MLPAGLSAAITGLAWQLDRNMEHFDMITHRLTSDLYIEVYTYVKTWLPREMEQTISMKYQPKDDDSG